MTGPQIDHTGCSLPARIAPILLGVAGVACSWFLVACSTLPPREWPAFDLRTVRVTFRTDGSPIEVPASTPSLTILDLAIEPPPVAEHWHQGRRLVSPPRGCTELEVRCTYRAYATDGTVPTPQQVFAGATRIEDVGP